MMMMMMMMMSWIVSDLHVVPICAFPFRSRMPDLVPVQTFNALKFFRDMKINATDTIVVKQGRARQGTAKHGKTGQGRAKHGKTGQGRAKHGTAGQGRARHGIAPAAKIARSTKTRHQSIE
jgi:hypothetical protein